MENTCINRVFLYLSRKLDHELKFVDVIIAEIYYVNNLGGFFL